MCKQKLRESAFQAGRTVSAKAQRQEQPENHKEPKWGGGEAVVATAGGPRISSAERGVWDQNVGAEGESFDVMEDIARRVPLSGIRRPAWDLERLSSLGLQAEADEEVWRRVWSEEETISFASTPLFLVRGRK